MLWLHADRLWLFRSGPARVYTMRGKYRQFILRVTAENSDEIVSASVPVSAERTVNLIVEVVIPLKIMSFEEV